MSSFPEDVPAPSPAGPIVSASLQEVAQAQIALSGGSARREAAWTLGAGLLIAMVAATMLIFPPPGFWGAFWGGDILDAQMPIYAEIDHALRHGEFPVLSLSSWVCGNLAGEYQYSIFCLPHLLILLIAFRLPTLASTAALIVVIYAAITAAGAFRLGRHYGLAVPLALITALVATLNGYGFCMGIRWWPPSLVSFAWLPWTWWALSIAVERPNGLRRFVPAGIFLYFLLAVGWPFTVLMAVVVTAWLCLKTGSAWRPRKLWPTVAAWLVGLALAAPAIGPLLEYYPYTLRPAALASIGTEAVATDAAGTYLFSMPFSALPGTILPLTLADWHWWGPPPPRPAYEMYCGLVPAVALFAGVLKFRTKFLRQYRWEFGLLVAVTLLCHYGATGTFRCPFRWLPLFHLLLGLLGALARAALAS